MSEKNGSTWLYALLAGAGSFAAVWGALAEPIRNEVRISNQQREESEARQKNTDLRQNADLLATESRILKELARLEETITNAQDRSTDNRNDIVALVEKLVEVETQFGATSQIRNAQRESDMQRVALLWQRVYQEPLPLEGTFYPHVGNGHGGGKGK